MNPLIVTYSNGKWSGKLQDSQMAEGWYWGVAYEDGPYGPFKCRSLAETNAKQSYPDKEINLGAFDPGYESTNN